MTQPLPLAVTDGPVEDRLRRARTEADTLFREIEARGLIHPGRSEREISQDVLQLAREIRGVHHWWHKRVVRCGANTIHSYWANPPDRVVEADDTVFLDLGPVFVDVEADFGRTYVLGDDPEKRRMQRDLVELFDWCRATYLARPEMTGAELYPIVVGACEARGWRYGGPHAGHLIGVFPHERRLGDDAHQYIRPENGVSMTAPDIHGAPRHWILEIHLVEPEARWGGFHEDLLSL
jgi:Xaa-Pro dipeptidase